MIILGLTGSIAMGKSTAAQMFRSLNVPVFDADGAVHRLLGRGGTAVAAVAAAFPDTLVGGAIERPLLARQVFGNVQALRRLEAILHPAVARERRQFVRYCARRKQPLVVLDIPLLFETKGEQDCDFVAVVSAPFLVQVQRLSRRPEMDRDRVRAILSRQMSDVEKRRRADFIIPSGLGKAATRRVIAGIVSRLRVRTERSLHA